MKSLFKRVKNKVSSPKSTQPPDPRSPIRRAASKPTTPFPQFSRLPKEIRHQIWYYALPGPRILLIKRRARAHFNGPYTRTTTAPASYGGHQPAILHVNQESRREALRYLTPLWNTYWNLARDTPYFELQESCWDLRYDGCYAISEMADMRRWGELDRFERVAIDWQLWEWEMGPRRPDHERVFGSKFAGYEHPITLLNLLPQLKCCIFVFTKHPFDDHELIVNPYVPWRLGPLTRHSILHERCEAVEEGVQQRIQRRVSELKGKDNLEIRVMAIHDRERRLGPEEYVLRGLGKGT